MKAQEILVIKSFLILISIVTAGALLEGGLLAQAQEAWVARYNGPGDDFDQGRAVAVDGAGNVYVTGVSTGASDSYDYFTVKYTKNGNLIWQARYDGPGNGDDWARDITIDDNGNVYVTGWSYGNDTMSDIATIKYDSAGNESWVERYDGPLNSYDGAEAITVDVGGNVYVTGYSTIDTSWYGNDIDYVTIKYDEDGNLVWSQNCSGYYYPSPDRSHAIEVDGSGNVYVTGEVYNSRFTTEFDYGTVKYDEDGNEQWFECYYGDYYGNDIATDIALDEDGNVYVTGESEVFTGTGYDYATIKYDTDGDAMWTSRYNGPASETDKAQAITLDSGSNVIVTGYSDDVDARNITTVKYDNDGNQLWEARDSNDYGFSRAVVVDSRDNVYVAGSRSSTGGSNYATLKYDAEGNEIWAMEYDHSADQDDAFDIVVTDVGDVYVTGGSAGDTSGSDYCTVKYRQNPLIHRIAAPWE